MARRRGWSLQTAFVGELSPENLAFAAQKRGEETFEWPTNPDQRVRISGVTDAPYAVDVELLRDREGGFVPVGVSVRRLFPTSRRKQAGKYVFAEGTQPERISAAEIRKIPFGRIIRAAITSAASMERIAEGADDRERILEERHEAIEQILVPRGRPKRGRSIPFYCELLKAARAFEKQGLSPAKEIAARKEGVSPNLIHQWLHVARGYEQAGLCDG